MVTRRGDAGRAVAWAGRRGWIEQSFKESKGGFGIDVAQIRCPVRGTRLLAALTLALRWLTLRGLPRLGLFADGGHAHVSQPGHAHIRSQALVDLDDDGQIPDACLPGTPCAGGRVRPEVWGDKCGISRTMAWDGSGRGIPGEPVIVIGRTQTEVHI